MNEELQRLNAVGDRFHNALTLVDLTQDDQPLVYVNHAFLELTGYVESEILGRNCRFLQGAETDRKDVAKLKAAIHDNQAVFCDLLNYRKDGSTFFNRLVLLPLQLDGRSHFIGMQIDSTRLLEGQISRGRTFDSLKTSEVIRDRLNTPLMKIWTALALAQDAGDCEEILQRAFGQVLDTVRSLPFR